jgi:hypothetical protein
MSRFTFPLVVEVQDRSRRSGPNSSIGQLDLKTHAVADDSVRNKISVVDMVKASVIQVLVPLDAYGGSPNVASDGAIADRYICAWCSYIDLRGNGDVARAKSRRWSNTRVANRRWYRDGRRTRTAGSSTGS